MHYRGNDIVFVPSDLTVFLESEFASWMDRREAERRAGRLPQDQAGSGPEPAPDPPAEEESVVVRRGLVHERQFLEKLRSEGRKIVEVDRGENAVEATLALIRSGREVIYQGHLAADGFEGRPDLLIRVRDEDRPAPLYEPWDAKLARSPKPAAVVQLCAYADLLEKTLGARPRWITLALGSGEAVRLPTDDYFFYYLQLKRAFLEFQAAFDPGAMPDPGLSASHGRWSTCAEAIFEASDHLSRIARITLSQIRKLDAAGIRTVSQLASNPPRRVPGMRQETLERLVVQARLQVGSRDLDRPLYEVRPPSPDDERRGLALLPPGSPSDIYFDMEGFPLVEGGLEYLFGAVTIEGGEPDFHDWWAHSEIEEKAAFEAFIDWVYARWKRDPTLHVYHYAAYEKTTLRRLMGKYATREHEVDDLLRGDVLVDLFTIISQGLVIGTPGYSLKDIEHIYSEKRSGSVTSAAGSIVAYERWLESGEGPTWQDSPILAEIREYNKQDCDSLRKLSIWLRDVQAASEIAFQEKARREPKAEQEGAEKRPETLLMERLLAEVAGGRIGDGGRRRLQELLAWMLDFHWREMKPLYWRKYERAEMTEEELIEDINCLGGLEQLPGRPFAYRFDPEAQDSKLDEGARCLFASDLDAHAKIERLDWSKGIVEIRPGRSAGPPPESLALIPDEYVNPKPIPQAVCRYVEGWAGGKVPSPAVDDLLNRRPPRVRGRSPGPLVRAGENLIPQLEDIVTNLDSSVLCIQGPPGTGKTYTAGRLIVDLMRKGQRIGVMANSHKATLKLLTAVVEAAETQSFRILKAGGESSGEEFRAGRIQHVGDSGKASRLLGCGPFTIGGTAWSSRDRTWRASSTTSSWTRRGRSRSQTSWPRGYRRRTSCSSATRCSSPSPSRDPTRARAVDRRSSIFCRTARPSRPSTASSSTRRIACTRTSAGSSRRRSTKGGSTRTPIPQSSES